ncbi:hypothetical protein FGB62_379g07 [Gracilaria domingensis]|nr:hypothetical protein FGB62_379g07 [Gracilaria domingensis]
MQERLGGSRTSGEAVDPPVVDRAVERDAPLQAGNSGRSAQRGTRDDLMRAVYRGVWKRVETLEKLGRYPGGVERSRRTDVKLGERGAGRCALEQRDSTVRKRGAETGGERAARGAGADDEDVSGAGEGGAGAEGQAEGEDEDGDGDHYC